MCTAGSGSTSRRWKLLKRSPRSSAGRNPVSFSPGSGEMLRMMLGISDCERAAPGAAEHEPALDAEVAPQGFQIGDQMRGGVVAQFPERARASRATLVVDHD